MSSPTKSQPGTPNRRAHSDSLFTKVTDKDDPKSLNLTGGSPTKSGGQYKSFEEIDHFMESLEGIMKPQTRHFTRGVDEEATLKQQIWSAVEARPYSGPRTGSSQTRLLIKGGKIVNDDMVSDGDVYVEDGLIKQIGRDLIIPGGTRTIEAKGKLVIPGGIDANTHFQLPLNGTKSADDFYSGTKSALAGGTTMIIDCAVDPSCSPLEAYEKWRNWADDKVCCDYGLQVAITSYDNKVRDEMDILVHEKGVNCFRVYMAYKDLLQLHDEELIRVLEVSKRLGTITSVHAENGDAIVENQKRILSYGITGPEGHSYSQPQDLEAEAAYRAIVLANQVSTPLLISPVMSKRAADVIVQKRNDGCIIYGEPITASLATDGTHYFNSCWSHAAGHVTSPPLSTDSSTPGHLMDLLGCGDLQTTGSNHCTYHATQKALGADDFTKIPHGVNGVEERMSLLWEKGVRSGKLDACRFVAVTSTNIAKLFNLYPRKGRIGVGSDADIVIWDPNKVHTISSKSHHSAVKFNIFEGVECRGAPLYVIAQGHLAVDEGELKVSQGVGRFVPLAPFSPHVFSCIVEREQACHPRKVNRQGYEGPVDAMNYNGDHNVITFKENPITASQGQEFHSHGPTRSGGRNLQDSTFSLSGAQIDDSRGQRSGIRVHNPPGGRSSGLW